MTTLKLFIAQNLSISSCTSWYLADLSEFRGNQVMHNFIRLVLPYVEGFDQVAGQASDQASDQADKLLKFCATPRSASEMMQHLGLSHRTYFRNTLLRPLMTSGKLAPTIPDKPSSPNQRYVSQEMPKAKAKE